MTLQESINAHYISFLDDFKQTQKAQALIEQAEQATAIGDTTQASTIYTRQLPRELIKYARGA